jgi:ABC-type uncharacterized transport system ATPase subunit
MSEESAPITEIELEYLPPSPDVAEIAPTLMLDGLTKQYQGRQILNGVTFTPMLGTIHAILGDAQAGKSTLLNLLSGFSTPDAGTIRWFGRPVTLHTPADALALGIGIVHQNPTFISTLSVGENIILGTADDGFPQFHRTPYRKIRALADDYGLYVNPSARIDALSRTEALHAELLRLLYRELNFLLLDDPFARLHPRTHEAFCNTLRRLAEAGKTILFTTTDPTTAIRGADLILVLHQGEVGRPLFATETTPAALYHAMTGHHKPPTIERPPATLGAVVLSTRHLSAPPALHDATLDLRRGELLAVLGLPESGQETLADILVGVRPFTGGQLFIGSEELDGTSQGEAQRLGVAYLPPITHLHTLANDMTVAENLALRSYQRLARGGMLLSNALNTHAQELLDRYQINTTPDTKVRDLSPTTKHRLLMARALADDYQLLVALYPTRGIAPDDALTIRRTLLAERARGKAVLLLTDDPTEAQDLADQIAVLREGRITKIRSFRTENDDSLVRWINGDDDASSIEP